MGHINAQRNLRFSTDRDWSRLTGERTVPDQSGVAVRPRVLILLAAYNGERWIAEQLQSILDQEGVDAQVIIRDDCSTDSTLAVARRLTSDRIAITTGSAPSGSASQNFFALIREHSAQGFDFVAFSDQDDLWDPNKLSRACRILTMNESVGYSSPVRAFWEQGEERILRQNPDTTRFDFLFEGAGQGCTFVLTAAFYERTRAFLCSHEALSRNIQFHDWAVYALARSWDLSWHFDSSPTMRYRQHGGNTIGAKKGIDGIRRRISLIRSGWYKAQLEGIAHLCVAAAPARTDLEQWKQLIRTSDGAFRRLQLARFCLAQGRRSVSERAVLLLTALSGWI